MGWLQEWAGDPGWASQSTDSLVTILSHSWVDQWSRTVSVKQDQDIYLNYWFLWTWTRKDLLYVTRRKEPVWKEPAKGKVWLEDDRGMEVGCNRESQFLEVHRKALKSSCAWKLCQGFHLPIVPFLLFRPSFLCLPLPISFLSISKIKVV